MYMRLILFVHRLVQCAYGWIWFRRSRRRAHPSAPAPTRAQHAPLVGARQGLPQLGGLIRLPSRVQGSATHTRLGRHGAGRRAAAAGAPPPRRAAPAGPRRRPAPRPPPPAPRHLLWSERAEVEVGRGGGRAGMAAAGEKRAAGEAAGGAPPAKRAAAAAADKEVRAQRATCCACEQ